MCLAISHRERHEYICSAQTRLQTAGESRGDADVRLPGQSCAGNALRPFRTYAGERHADLQISVDGFEAGKFNSLDGDKFSHAPPRREL